MELNKAKSQIKEAETAISSQKAEIEKLNHIINEADQERIRQKKEYDVVVNERDILGTQLIRWALASATWVQGHGLNKMGYPVAACWLWVGGWGS